MPLMQQSIFFADVLRLYLHDPMLFVHSDSKKPPPGSVVRYFPDRNGVMIHRGENEMRSPLPRTGETPASPRSNPTRSLAATTGSSTFTSDMTKLFSNAHPNPSVWIFPRNAASAISPISESGTFPIDCVAGSAYLSAIPARAILRSAPLSFSSPVTRFLSATSRQSAGATVASL